MANIVTTSLSKKEGERLQEAAIQYGISPEKLSRLVIAQATKELLDIPEESLDEYKHPEQIISSYKKAIKEAKKGELLTSLPRNIRSVA